MTYTFRQNIACALSLFVAIFSSAVCVGWLFSIPFLVRPLPTLEPMQFNASICFLVLSLAVIFSSSDSFSKFSRVLTSLCTIVCLAAVLEHLFTFLFGTKTFFLNPLFVDENLSPGSMALSSIVAFICTSLSFIAFSRVGLNRTAWILGALFSLSLSFTALSFYAVDFLGQNVNEPLIGMSFYSSVLHILLATSTCLMSPLKLIRRASSIVEGCMLAMPLISGVGLSLFAWQMFLSVEGKARIETLKYDAQSRSVMIKNAYKEAIDNLFDVRLFYEGSEFVDENEFDTFAKALVRRSPALMAIDWSPRVLHSNRSKIENEITRVSGNKFQQLDMDRKLNSREQAAVYFPVRYTMPKIENGLAYGFDHYSDGFRKDAMDSAAIYNDAVATRPFTLFRIHSNANSPEDMLIVLPVFKKDVSTSSITSADSTQVLGFLIAAVRASILFQGVFADVNDLGLNISLHYQPGENASTILSYSYLSKHSEAQDILPLEKSQYSERIPLNIAHSHWYLEITPTKKYLANYSSSGATLILLISTFASFLVTAYFLLLRESHQETLENSKTLHLINKALKEREEWFSQLAKTSPVGIFRTDASGKCEFVNNAWTSLTGYTIEHALGDGWTQAVHPDDREEVYRAWQESTKSGNPFKREFRFLRPDNEVRWTIGTSEAVLDSERRVIGYVGTNFDLTNRKKYEEQLTEISSIQRAIIENAGYSIISTDCNGKVMTFNSAAESMLGYSAEEVVGLQTPALWHDADEVERMAKELSVKFKETIKPGFDVFIAELRNKNSVLHEWTYIAKDGHHFQVLLSVTAIKNNDGKVTGYLGMAADITEFVRLREEVTQSEARLRLTTEAAGIGTWELDLINDSLMLSAELCTILGLKKTNRETELSALERFCHAEDRASFLKLINTEQFIEDRSEKFEFRMRNSDGSYTWFLGTSKVVERDETGKAIRILAIQIDISFLKSVQKELELAKSQTEAFVRYAPASVAMFDKKMRYVGYSEKWRKDYGLLDQEILGRSHYEVFPEITEQWKEIHAKCLKGAVERRDAEVFERADGSKQWLQWEVRPWLKLNGDIGGVAMFTEDITEKQQTLEKLEEARRAAEAATQAKASFLANMSHEIRTPLTAVIGYSEQLLAEELPHEERVSFTQNIVQSSGHLLELINEVLDFSKIEAGMYQISKSRENLFDLLEIIDSTFSKKVEEKRLSFGIEYCFPVPQYIFVDSLRVRQILINLVGNAVKFTEKGGVKLVIDYVAKDHEVVFKVVDTGIGLSKEQLSRLFQAFSQADSSTTKKYGGTGLGLSISQRLAELMGGEITVDSEYGEGSTFSLKIPVGAEASHVLTDTISSKNSNESSVHINSGVQGRVLLVEDVTLNQQLFSRILKKAGLEVVIAENGKAGLERALEEKFELVLMDMQMPIMDGYTATQELRKNNYMLPIVGCTADASVDGRMRCIKSGCDEVLVKPFTSEHLAEILKKFITTHKRTEHSDLYSVSEFPQLQIEFLHKVPKKIDEIVLEIEMKTSAEVHRLAHNLRGGSGLHQLKFLQEIAKKVENAAKTKSWSKLELLKEELNKAKKTVEQIRVSLESQYNEMLEGQLKPEEDHSSRNV